MPHFITDLPGEVDPVQCRCGCWRPLHAKHEPKREPYCVRTASRTASVPRPCLLLHVTAVSQQPAMHGHGSAGHQHK